MKVRTGDLLLLLFSLLLVVVVIEGGYRVFLWNLVSEEREKSYKPDPNPSFRFYGWPPPWRFDLRFGFLFNEGPWLAGKVEKGRFDTCGPEGQGNRFGNFGPPRGNYETAGLKIAFFGSSYTLIDHGWKGDTTTNLLQEALTKRLGKRVNILNFSRDATGFLTMFDIARAVATEYKPDLMLFTFNITALGYRRHWRVVKEVRPDFYRMYFVFDPGEKIDPARSIVHVNPITKRVTPEWCTEMKAAKARHDENRLRNNPLVLELIAEYRGIMRERTLPRVAIDFFDLRVSFVYNRLTHGEPFYRMRMFSEESVWAPLSPSSYADDAGLVEAVAAVKASRIPFYVIHLPMLEELRGNVRYASGHSGLTDAQQTSALRSIAELTGKDIIRLLDYYSRERLADPLRLVMSEADSHPSPAGVVAMVEALERMLVDRGIVHSAADAAVKGANFVAQRRHN